MAVLPGELLHRLAGGVRPAAELTPSPVGDRPALDFEGMLARAQRGTLRTGLPVGIPATLAIGLDDHERERLAAGVDLAQAEGIRRALIEVNGRTFRVDVDARQVIDAPDAHGVAVGGIDGAVLRAETEEDSDRPGAATLPARVVRNATLLDALADVRRVEG